MARYPAHNDKTPSMSVSLGEDNRLLVYCHGTCETSAVLEAMGLTMRELFPEVAPRRVRLGRQQRPQRSEQSEVTEMQETSLPGLIDWENLFSMPPFQEEWLAPYLIPAGRTCTLFDEAKAGKSLPTLEAVAAIATGKPFFGQPTKQVKVLYIDFENNPYSDVLQRLVRYVNERTTAASRH